VSVTTESRGATGDLPDALRALWGKTDRRYKGDEAQRPWHPLVAHMIDTAVVAAWLWDHWLPPAVQRLFGPDSGHGRAMFMWLAGLHDLGKASPAFQCKNPIRARGVEDAGLPVTAQAVHAGAAKHALVSGIGLVDLLRDQGWARSQTLWPGLVLAGHHGAFPDADWLSPKCRPDAHLLGEGAWYKARAALVDMMTDLVGVAAIEHYREQAPRLAAQLVICGAVILADWLASTEELFPYVGDDLDGYRLRAERRVAGGQIRDVLGLRHVWMPTPECDAALLCGRRFGRTPRAVQRAAVSLAAAADRPGLLLVEAPMGEGKTEAALLAAEVLAARFGLQGLFLGLPTQATATTMFTRISGWLHTFESPPTVALAHAKAMRQEEYRALIRPSCVDDDGDTQSGLSASEWFSGRKKSLLAPVVVGTVDQVLMAGVSANHVALRHLGLAGKVVVVDEVHAYDAYMSVLLRRVLAWLGQAEVPVVLLSATLPSASRRKLLAAYAGGELVESEPEGYPRLTFVAAPQVRRTVSVFGAPRKQDMVTPTVVTETASRSLTAWVALRPEKGIYCRSRGSDFMFVWGGVGIILRV